MGPRLRFAAAAFLLLANCSDDDTVGVDAPDGGSPDTLQASDRSPTDQSIDGALPDHNDAPFDAAIHSGVDQAEAPGPAVFMQIGDGAWAKPGQPGPGQAVRIRYAGSLVDAGAVSIHYGFDGWDVCDLPGVTATDDGTGNIDCSIDQPMTPVNGGYNPPVFKIQVRQH